MLIEHREMPIKRLVNGTCSEALHSKQCYVKSTVFYDCPN
ncbi:hypothetical protein DB29_02911 [Shouchella clausii]|nr:hypothetical protein DB29_02911 [Shouchella clausii]